MSFILSFRFHIKVIIHSICLSLTYFTKQVHPWFFQMAKFFSVSWLVIYHCVCVCVCVYVCVCACVCACIPYAGPSVTSQGKPKRTFEMTKYSWHFCIHSSVDGHLGCFHILAVVNSAAMNTGAHVSFQISVFSIFTYSPRSGIAGSYGSSILGF